MHPGARSGRRSDPNPLVGSHEIHPPLLAVRILVPYDPTVPAGLESDRDGGPSLVRSYCQPCVPITYRSLGENRGQTTLPRSTICAGGVCLPTAIVAVIYCRDRHARKHCDMEAREIRDLALVPPEEAPSNAMTPPPFLLSSISS
ncbi:hypothetical protein BV20DRAFT_811528 [Pilatotrama ljubarskyi]|nr:hypothetical protein BV20DRAFT_811528 [Pilatotrama ljubarskyi]